LGFSLKEQSGNPQNIFTNCNGILYLFLSNATKVLFKLTAIFLIFLILNYSTYNGNQKTKTNHEKNFKK